MLLGVDAMLVELNYCIKCRREAIGNIEGGMLVLLWKFIQVFGRFHPGVG